MNTVRAAVDDIVKGLSGIEPETPRRVFATAEEFEAYKAAVHANHTHRFGDFWLNTITHECSEGKLAPVEFLVLRELVEECPNPLHGDEIGLRVSRHYNYRGQPLDQETIKVYVRRLRQKIGPRFIRTVPVGYVFVPFPEAV